MVDEWKSAGVAYFPYSRDTALEHYRKQGQETKVIPNFHERLVAPLYPEAGSYQHPVWEIFIKENRNGHNDA